MRSIFISAAFLLFAAGTALTMRDFADARRINVVILTVESARLDAFDPETTPILWNAARQGTRFVHHRSASAWTGANMVSLLTGLSVFQHGIHSRDTSIPAAWRTPLERLTAQGWHVAGFQPFMLTEGFQNLGVKVHAATALYPWLADSARKNRSFVAWYHYLDTHLPYELSPHVTAPADPAVQERVRIVSTKPTISFDAVQFRPEDLAWIAPLYRAQFHKFDRWFGEFWRFFNKSGLRDKTILILTTDHGEELLERGLVGHASTTRAGHLYDEITRIPLIIWLPPALVPDPPPAVVDSMSSHLDIMPTILSRLGLSSTSDLQGRDLFDLPAERSWEGLTSRAGFAEPDPNSIKEFTAARVENNWKLHLDITWPATVNRAALFNLADDPAETIDLAQRESDRVDRMSHRLMTRIVSMRIGHPIENEPSASGNAAPLMPPRWIFPAASGTLGYAQLPNPLQLRWHGPSDAAYRLQYRAGDSENAIAGEIAATGPLHDFGPIGQDYWRKYIVPYKSFRFRVGYAGRDDLWSPWLTIEVQE